MCINVEHPVVFFLHLPPVFSGTELTMKHFSSPKTVSVFTGFLMLWGERSLIFVLGD